MKDLENIGKHFSNIGLPVPSAQKKVPKNILIIGWLGAFNLGDEMMLDVTLKEMERRGCKVTLVTHKIDGKVKRRYRGHTVIARRTITTENIKDIVTKHDGFFVNGGALIDDYRYSQDISLATSIAHLAKEFIRQKKKVVIYGVSTNASLESKKLIEDYTYIIKHAAHFSTRDTLSRDELERITKLSVEVVDDIELADETLLIKDTLPKGQKFIGITPVFGKDTIEYLKVFFEKLTAATDAPLRLILFYDENNNDAKYTEELRKYLGGKRFAIEEVAMPSNSADLFTTLHGVDVYISMRYHGTLFGNMIGRKVISLEYDFHPHYHNKNQYLHQHYHFNESTIKLSEVHSLGDSELRQLIESTRAVSTDIKRIQRRSKRSLLKAINLLWN